MTQEDFRRKLTAILSADVQGYSLLMREDEAATVRTLTAHHQAMAAHIGKHGGRVVDSPGDNLLAEFASVVDAVRCAVEIQEGLRARNAELPEDRRMHFRIGVNLGDVIEQGAKIYGDGVNIAARVESLADGGGICISGTVHHHVKNKLPFDYEYLGDYTVKNIAEPVPVYRIRMEKGGVVRGDRARPKGLRLGSRVFLVALVLLVLAAWFTRGHWMRSDKKERSAEEGFQLLRMGKLAKAETTFNSLEGKSPGYHQGLAAVHLSRGDLEKAEEIYDLAVEHNPDHPYCMVLKAQLLLCKGQLEEAEKIYNKVLEARDLLDWQRAECYFGLGRIRLQRGDLAKAVEGFDRALALDPTFVKAHTAKALAMERMGKIRDAMAHYKKASKVNPSDPVSALLYTRAKEQVSVAEVPDRKARIDALVAELSKAYREGPRKAEERDEWSSIPLYLFPLDLEAKGQPSPTEGEDAFISEHLIRRITASPRLHRVERVLLHRLLEELKLSNSELSDPETALRLGRILSARILLTGKVIRYKGQIQVSLRAIDTETTSVVATATGTCQMGEDPEEMLLKLAREFLGGLASAYPIRARITEVRAKEVVLNVGSLMGAAPGMKMQVVEQAGRGAEVEVKDVQDRSCTAIFRTERVDPERDWRVEEIRT